MLSALVQFVREYHGILMIATLVISFAVFIFLGKVDDMLSGEFGVAGRAFGPLGRGKWWRLKRLLTYCGLLAQLLLFAFSIVLIATVPWGIDGRGGTFVSVLGCLAIMLFSLGTAIFFSYNLR
jgi:hypothetical protein